MKMDNKIQCIKELIRRTKVGLIDAKLIIDHVEHEFGCLEIDIAELFVDYVGRTKMSYYGLAKINDAFAEFVKEFE